MEDKFIKGIICGLYGGIVKDILGFIVKYFLKFTSIIYWDYAGILAYGRPPKTLLEIVIAILIELGFGVSLGIIFIYLTALIKSKHYLLKESCLDSGYGLSYMQF
jgi:hypothetical protein